jgi:hypothetical protein
MTNERSEPRNTQQPPASKAPAPSGREGTLSEFLLESYGRRLGVDGSRRMRAHVEARPLGGRD